MFPMTDLEQGMSKSSDCGDPLASFEEERSNGVFHTPGYSFLLAFMLMVVVGGMNCRRWP